MDDTYCGVSQGDANDLNGTIAIKKESWGIAAGVADEVEPRPIAVGWPEAEGVWHAHIAAGGVAVGLPPYVIVNCCCCKFMHKITGDGG